MFTESRFSRLTVALIVILMIHSTIQLIGGPGDVSTVPVDGDGAVSREGLGELDLLSNPGTETFRGVEWREGGSQVFMVGKGVVKLLDTSTGNITELSGPESTDHYYEDIAWRPGGDYAIIVGTTPASTKERGVVAKMWKEGVDWRISALTTSVNTTLTGVDWSADGNYAVIVGGARSGESKQVPAMMLRLSGTSNQISDIMYDDGDELPNGLSDVAYNEEGEYFLACGLDGSLVRYDGDDHEVLRPKSLKDSHLFAVSWRDNYGKAVLGGWFGATLKGHLATTDGRNKDLIDELAKYINDADWAPNTDHSLLVGQSGFIVEYDLNGEVQVVENTLDDSYYYGVDFNDGGTSAVIVGGDGKILQYNVTYPPKENHPPEVVIGSPREDDSAEYGESILFSANGTSDPDLDYLDYEWTSDEDGGISGDKFFSVNDLSTGDHMITLSVDDANGHVVSATVNITVLPPSNPPQVDAGDDIIGYVNKDISLVGEVLHSEYEITTYEWDFNGSGVYRKTETPVTEHRYGERGVYTVIFRVTDTRQARGQDTVNVSVFPSPFSARSELSMDPTEDIRPEDTVTLSLNRSCSHEIELHIINPKNEEMTLRERKMDGESIFSYLVPKKAEKGDCDVKWRYFNDDGNHTEWYTVEDAFHVHVPDSGNGDQPDYTPLLAGVALTGIIIFVIVVVILFLYNRPVTRVDACLLFYRDGRIMHTYLPPQKKNEATISKNGQGDQGDAQQKAYQVQNAVQQQISNIRQGTQEKLPNKLVQGKENILIEQGMHTLMALALRGEEPEDLRKRMKNVIQEIEMIYGNQLRQWDGTVAGMPNIQAVMEKNITVRD